MRLSYIIIPLLVGAGVSAWYWKHTHPDVVEVSVVEAQPGDVEETVANTRAGTVKACRRAKMSPSIGGQISELPYPEGAYVKKDAVLLKVWNDDLQAEIDLNQKSIETAKQTAKASCLQADVAQRSANRSARLRREGTISQEAYDKAITEAQVRKADCKAARDNIIVAKARLKMAKAQLKRTILYAPFNGVIAKINGELNEYVTPSPPGILTPPVIDLIEPGCFYVSVPIDEVDAPKVKRGLPARVTLDAWRGRIFEAEVSRIGSYVVDREKQARTVDIELTFKNAADLSSLLVGYSADADIILRTHHHVLRIPGEALLDDNHVLLFNPQNHKLEKREIEKGLSNWTYSEIVKGLKQGDKVVTSLGAEGVEEGALARIKGSASPKNGEASAIPEGIQSEIEADYKAESKHMKNTAGQVNAKPAIAEQENAGQENAKQTKKSQNQ